MAEDLKEEMKRQKMLEKSHKKEFKRIKSELRGRSERQEKIYSVLTFIWKHTFAKIGEDWVFLAILGMLMALVSFAMDYTIALCNNARLWLVQDLVSNIYLQFLAWVCLPTVLILFSTGFVHVVAPQAIGSGIPEMKVILRGVVLKEYLTFRTFIAKAVGLTATLGSGMPLGKEGPFVHIASIVATLLTKLVTSFNGIYANESRNSEMLAAAVAVGVACCFASPIGGVLFSIEVTSVYFAVRNYWRGFFAAIIGALCFAMLCVWFDEPETIVPHFPTGFSMEFPYDPQELLVFTLIGVVCGFGGGLYVFTHRKYVLWMRGNKKLTAFLQKNRFIYPFCISFLIASLTFPAGPGAFQAADVSSHHQIGVLFSNYTWTRNISDMTVEEYDHVKHWRDPVYDNIFVVLTVYIISTFFLSILAATLPVPTGVLIPSFKIGAAFGRMVGEAMALWYPHGIRYGPLISHICPGGYATVGAAAFTGAVTHTLSISVIVFEMTGQITHAIPILIAVLVANAIAACLGPSCYDSIILIKKLPYLPDIIPSSSGAYNFFVEDFMVKDIKYIWYGMTFNQLREVLKINKKLRGFPLVDNPTQMILLGSVQRTELIAAIEKQVGKERRLLEASKRRALEQEAFLMKQEKDRIKELEKELNVLKQETNDDDDGKENNPAPKNTGRRPSRFEISSVDDTAMSPASTWTYDGGRRLKGILKKYTDTEPSHTIHGHSGTALSPPASPYLTVSETGNWRNTVQNVHHMFKRTLSSRASSGWDFGESFLSPGGTRKFLRPEMSLEEQRVWEKQEMEKTVNFSDIHIDPAPFQLVEKSSLLKVHSLFSMLGVNHAYVTTIGRLIGVVGLKELRKAIEDANSGQAAETPMTRDIESPNDSGARKRKGGQANVNGQGGQEYLTVASMDSALSHSLASEDSDNDLLE